MIEPVFAHTKFNGRMDRFGRGSRATALSAAREPAFAREPGDAFSAAAAVAVRRRAHDVHCTVTDAGLLGAL